MDGADNSGTIDANGANKVQTANELQKMQIS